MIDKKQNTDAGENDENLPGYPHYPAQEDIYRQEEKTDFDEEGLPKKELTPIESELDTPASPPPDEDEILPKEDEENDLGSTDEDENSDLEETDEDNGQ